MNTNLKYRKGEVIEIGDIYGESSGAYKFNLLIDFKDLGEKEVTQTIVSESPEEWLDNNFFIGKEIELSEPEISYVEKRLKSVTERKFQINLNEEELEVLLASLEYLDRKMKEIDRPQLDMLIKVPNVHTIERESIRVSKQTSKEIKQILIGLWKNT